MNEEEFNAKLVEEYDTYSNEFYKQVVKAIEG